MKTSVIEVRDMLSALGADEVETRIGKVPGVESATVNYAAGSATVHYDETRLEVADIKSPCTNVGISLQANFDPSIGANTSPHASVPKCQRRKLRRPPLQRSKPPCRKRPRSRPLPCPRRTLPQSTRRRAPRLQHP